MTGETRQLLTVVAAAPGSSHAELTAWNRTANGAWSVVLGPLPARVGARGIGAASEGSTLTPAGTFPLRQAFGRLPDPGSKIPYFVADRLDWWDANPQSASYNRHLRQRASPGGDSENLYDVGDAYNYAIAIGYNSAGVPRRGSAFFVHVGTGSATAGCVSVDQPALKSLLCWLDPQQSPQIEIRIGPVDCPLSADLGP